MSALRGSAALAAALAALLIAAIGCGKSTEVNCPGRVAVRLALHGTLDDAATGCTIPPPGGWAPPSALPEEGTEGGPEPTFDAVFAWDEAQEQFAYCTGGDHAAVLQGTRSGAHVVAEAVVEPAVLAACAVTCTPRMTLIVEGDLTGGNAVPLTFSGTITETFDASAGCAPCELPCTSRYLVTGTEQ